MRTFIMLLILGSTLATPVRAQFGTSIRKPTPNYHLFDQNRDTLHFPRPDFGVFTTCAVTLLDSLQIDGSGRAELAFRRTCAGSVSEHGGTFDIEEQTTETRYEVWNLDTRTCLLSVVETYQFDFNRFQIYANPVREHGSVSYHYRVWMDSAGTIGVKFLDERFRRKEDGPFGPTRADTTMTAPAGGPTTHVGQAGVYRWHQGAYVRTLE